MSDSAMLHDTYPLILWYAYPVGLITQTCGVYLTVLVSVHRYLGVCHPFRAKRWISSAPVKSAIIGSILFSVLINLNYWLELSIENCYSENFKQAIRSIALTPLKMDVMYHIITRVILYTLVMFVIPFITLIIVNWRIIVALKESTRMRNQMHSSKKSNPSRIIHQFRLLKNAKYSDIFGKFGRINFNILRTPSLLKTNTNSVRDRSVTLMLLAIVAIFLICNCLAFCNNIYEIFRDATQQIETGNSTMEYYIEQPSVTNDEFKIPKTQDMFDLSVELSNILISLNSSSSMFVYLIFSSKYRTIIKHWLGLEQRKKVNGVALTTAMMAQKALELSILPDEAEARRSRREKGLLATAKKRCRANALATSETDLRFAEQKQRMLDAVEESNVDDDPPGPRRGSRSLTGSYPRLVQLQEASSTKGSRQNSSDSSQKEAPNEAVMNLCRVDARRTSSHRKLLRFATIQ